jgi:ComF family protein
MMMMIQSDLLTRTWTGLLDLVFAPVCLTCGDPIASREPRSLVCGVCWSRCRPLPSPRCARCWNPVDPHREPSPVCRTCAVWPAGVRAIRSAFALGEVPRKLAHALKYGGWSAAAEEMGARMALLELPPDTRAEARLVLPVPTSRTRLRERGYNQAALLARHYAAHRGLEYLPERLLRVRSTASQTSLHPGDRRANVARAFAVPDSGVAKALLGEHVVLIDDVWTTGATALACAEALRDAGARAVSVVTFARAVPELKRS